ncbi:MAG: RNA polymerase sigma factor [Chitinophagales bacterium]
MTDKVHQRQLIKACMRGDRTAQNQLYKEHKYKMMGVCLRYAKDRAEAEDILQDGFFKVFCDLKQFSGTGPLGAWIRRVMVNTALMHVRKNKNKLFPSVELEKVEHKQASEEDLFSRFRMQALVQMIQRLPDGYRMVFNMYVIEGYSHKEIAKQLDISESTSKSQLSRAKMTLRQMLEKQLIK